MTIKKISTPQPGVWLEVDVNDAATPVLVCGKLRGDLFTSTYDCAVGTGFIDDVIELEPKTLAWLEQQSDMVEDAISKAREGHDEYS